MTKLDKSLSDIAKKYGDGAVFKLGGDVLKVEVISTGLPSLDAALRAGGLPKGRIVEIYGWEQSCKTTLCYRIVAEIQKFGGLAALIDYENSCEINWAKTCGVDVNNLYVSQPNTGEEGLEVVRVLVDSGLFDVIVIDSTNAILTKAELEGEIGARHVGLNARLISQSMRLLDGPIKKSNTIVILISQMRAKIGAWGNPNAIGTGESVKYYASIRLETTRGETLTEAGKAIGSKIKVNVRKNKVGSPGGDCELRLYFDRGLDPVADTVLFAVTHGLIEKRGAWYIFENLKEQGETNFINLIRNNPEAYAKLQLEVSKVDKTPKKR
jgi:recombination protein RecA